ncbi:hypothetical protein ACFQU7_25010 [Pseudoroseomonas wenyumeiae]
MAALAARVDEDITAVTRRLAGQAPPRPARCVSPPATACWRIC